MRINNNLMAMNTHRQLGMANTGGAKSMEKLSSGLRINRAGDDAAGLAISEKMRGQIRGLNQASANAQDGISLIQTTEGALNETHAILQRMRELAVQSSTDTNTNPDRGNLQDEMDQLSTEITRIAETTQFNTMNLLDGSFSGKKFHIGANEGQTVDLNIGKMDVAGLGLTASNSMETIALTAGSDLADGVYTIKGTNVVDASGNTVGTTDGAKVTINGKDTSFVTSKAGEGATLTVKAGSVDLKNTITGGAKDLAPGNYEIKGTNVVKDDKIIGAFAGTTITLTNGDTATEAELGFKTGELKDGASFKINGSDVSTREAASASITSINGALESVSKERSKLGAIQNRLEHTIKNLDTSSENLQASEARIRDVDMAKEMMEQTKQNILQQASTAMLAQANQAPQTVLSLLR